MARLPFFHATIWTALAVLISVSFFPTTTLAAPPTVVASIKPIQALVKMVMGPIGTPDLIVPATASPHVFSLKPSQAKKLEQADVVFWIGPTLETTLEGPLDKLAKNARVISLLNIPELSLINRTDTDGHEHTDDKAHNEAIDPHIWLSPTNAKVMLAHIEQTLIAVDPPNAPEYAANAKKAKRRISILINKTNKFTEHMHDKPYLVQHDGFGYLAQAFGFQEAGFIQTHPGREPGAKHISQLIETIKARNVKCLFHEPQFTPKLAKRLGQEHGLSLREIDPMGTDLSLSDTTYVRIIQGIVLTMQSCLDPHLPGDGKEAHEQDPK
ncbi:MAG: zinc ABC transporter substrate-binding protein [Magnetovibrio sp.]|nr:zinc ABC transporter substrate-binding protein [Magnetovibrio sp.]